MIEAVFGNIKANHQLTHFCRRGLDAAKTEWLLMSAAMNICILHTLNTAPAHTR
ncbi:transposase [Corynebacterium cystitidis]|uniref:transposase n=1 Tax=Corynebacterium cystitidis TaxID=35757 RepID=UPI00358DC6BD